MEFDETPRFWYPCIALVAWINCAFSPDENLRSDFRRSEKEAKRRKNKNKILSFSPRSPSVPSDLPFIFLFLIYYYYYYFWIHGSYCFFRVRFYPVTICFVSVHFILNELSPSHFLTFEIFVKISSLKSLATYYPENRKIFRLSQNSTKLLWVIRFR